MNNEKKIFLLQPIGMLGLLFIGFGVYVEVIGNKEIITTKFFGELSGYSKELIVFGVFLIIFYFYLLLPALKKRSTFVSDFLSKKR